MTYLRLKKINAIKKKISRKHVLELPFSEICLYVEHRISKLLSQAIAASKLEIKYNLCEVGPGRSRLDPWTVEIVLNSQLFQKTSFLEKTTVNDILFFSRIKESNLAVKEVIKQKAPLLAKTMDMITEQNISIELLNQFKKSPAVFHINEEYFDKNKRFLEFAFSINEKDFILRLYNIIDWIYPNSTEIWSLVHKARQNHLQPIMLAPHIHGSCFLILSRGGLKPASQGRVKTGQG